MTALYGTIPPTEKDGRRAARRLLAFAVFRARGRKELPEICRGASGKPFFPQYPGLHFSLSHTAGLCLCALSDGGPVGVDCEMVRPRRPDLPGYVMSEAELAAFDGSWERFYEIWTLKEAYCKYEGRSIFPPKSVPAPPPVPCRTYAGGSWRAALCGGGPLPQKIFWVDEGALFGTY